MIKMPKTLAELRTDKFLSVDELALKAGVAQRTITRIEGGVNPHPLAKTVKRLAFALDVPASELALTQTPRFKNPVRVDSTAVVPLSLESRLASIQNELRELEYKTADAHLKDFNAIIVLTEFTHALLQTIEQLHPSGVDSAFILEQVEKASALRCKEEGPKMAPGFGLKGDWLK